MKCVIMVYDINACDTKDVGHIGEWAFSKGYEMLMLGIDAAMYTDPQAIRIIDMSNLPPAEIEELRRLCAEKVAV